jgi:hypothetical protein
MARYLLIQKYEGGNCDEPMGAWDAADIRGHIDFQIALNAELTAAGELIDAQGVGEDAKRVVSDGTTSTVSVPRGEVLLAGYRLVDVESEERALQIAARSSAAPGPRGRPLEQPIEVRPVMVAR